jgi:hypothetical protein
MTQLPILAAAARTTRHPRCKCKPGVMYDITLCTSLLAAAISIAPVSQTILSRTYLLIDFLETIRHSCHV